MTPKQDEGSIFKSLLQQARGEDPIPLTQENDTEEIPSLQGVRESQQEEPKRVGRPRGRRSDPTYTQISAYVPLALYHEVQRLLLEERIASGQRSGVDLSGLVEELLRQWVECHKQQ